MSTISINQCYWCPLQSAYFIGKTAAAVSAGYVDFRLGRQYYLTGEPRADDTVAIQLDHHEQAGTGPMVLSERDYKP